MNTIHQYKKWIGFGLVAIICIGIGVTLYSMEPEQPIELRQTSVLATITIKTTHPQTRQEWIKAYGQAASKWSTTLKSLVNGRIVYINSKLQPGNTVREKEVLLRIDPTDYQAELAQARLELENARVSLLTTQRQADQARLDWKHSGLTEAPSSDLVFYKPQLAAARAQLRSAEKSLQRAQKDLNNTVVLSPYSGLVVKRFSNRGEALFTGDSIAKIESADDIEIHVSLDREQTEKIGLWQNAEVQILDPEGKHKWRGKILRQGGVIDDQTRLRKFYIVPQSSDYPIMPGMFAAVMIRGQKDENLLALPESALTRDGYVWYVDEMDRLQQIRADISFFEPDRVYIKNTAHFDQIRVVINPVQDYIAGTKINPVPEGGS